MSRSQKKTVDQSKPAPKVGARKRYRLELTLGQILMCAFCLFVVLSWMFVFGILVGRGLPLADAHKAGLGNDFMRFIGLARQPPATPTNAAQSWVKSNQMLKSLDYYQTLTQKPPAAAAGPQAPAPAPAKAAAKPSRSPASPKAAPPAPSTQTASAQTEAAAQDTNTSFTLLAASLKSLDNAQRFVAQLQKQGYPARVETVDMADSGRWYRVLVGSFDTRDQALQFAAEFNQKEQQQALVIQLGP